MFIRLSNTFVMSRVVSICDLMFFIIAHIDVYRCY